MLIVLISSTATAKPIRITDDRGVTVTLAAPAQRIVSLLPSLTESVCALDACDRLVGVDRYSDWPASIKRLPILGGIDDTPIERVVSLKPDVVLAARSSRAIARLEQLNITVIAIEPQSLADVNRALDRLGDLLDRSVKAQTLKAQITTQIAHARSQIPKNRLNATVYFEVADGPYVASRGSFIGQVLEAIGLKVEIPEDLGAFPKMNPEWIIKHPPDIIMLSQDSLSAFTARPLMNRLDAVNSQQWCAFDNHTFEQWVRPGPRLGEVAEQIAHCVANLPARASK